MDAESKLTDTPSSTSSSNRSLIGLTADNTLVSRVVRWFTRSPYSHAMIMVDGYVYEAAPQGFVKIPESSYDTKSIKKLYDLQTPIYPADVAILDSWVSRPYGWWELIGQAIENLLKRISIRIRNPFKSALGLMCSEAVIDWLQVLHYPQAENLAPEDFDPQEVDDFLLAHPPAVIVWNGVEEKE